MSRSSTKHRSDSLIKAACWFPHALLANECELYSTKWFDYRFLSPLDATLDFARSYRNVFQRIFARDIDRDHARSVIGANPAMFQINATERTQMWMARARADQVGMRYEDYIGFSFDFSARRGLERKKLPRPNQLHHGGEKAHAHWLQYRDERWQEVVREGTVSVSDLAAYRVENRRGIPAQVAFREFAVEQSLAGGLNLGQAMEIYCVQNGQLCFTDYEDRFDAELYGREKERAESSLRNGWVTPVPAPVLTPVSLLPCCFGLPSAPMPERPVCASCAVYNQCLTTSIGVLRKVKDHTGTATPVEDAKLRNTATRVRKWRARKKNASAASSMS